MPADPRPSEPGPEAGDETFSAATPPVGDARAAAAPGAASASGATAALPQASPDATAALPRPAPAAGSESATLAAEAAPWQTTDAPSDAPTTGPGGRPGAADEGNDDDAPPLPRRVGRYEVISELGRGGMGVVYEAYDKELRRHVAVKMIRLMDGSAGTNDLERFLREARVSAKLDHPSIVRVHEVGSHAGDPFLVMEIVRGESFEGALRRERMPPRRAAEVLRDVASGLQHAHDQGVIHRDVKPHNILLDEDGHAKLGDFGLARDEATRRQLTITGQVMGTPAFMSPEQAAGERQNQGPLTDVWAVGAVLYRALVGRPPFGGDTALVIMRKVLVEDPAAPRQLDPTIHPDLETIVLRCLEKTPQRRYPSAAAVAADLDRYLRGLAIVAKPPGRVDRLRRWTRRHPARAVIALVALIFPIALLATFALQRAARQAVARNEALAAVTPLEEALAELASPLDDPVARRRARKRRIELGLEAMSAASRFRSVAGDHAFARELQFRAAQGLGQAALEAEQWELAESALSFATTIGHADAWAEELLEEVAARRAERAAEDRERIARVIEDARAGELLRRPGGEDEALVTLIGLGDEATASLLADALDEISSRLWAKTGELLAGVVDADGDEAAALDAALARVVAETATPDDLSLVGQARRRLLYQAARRWREVSPGTPPSSLDPIAVAHDRTLGSGDRVLARLCCEALGRIGQHAGSVDALGRYLAAESDEERALVAGVALVRIGGARAERRLLAALDRFGEAGPFWQRVRVALFRSDQHETELAATSVEELIQRGILAGARGHHDGARADFDRALALDPGNGRALALRALTREQQGEPEGALADLDAAVAASPNDAVILTYRGSVRRHQAMLEEARADFTAAIEADPRRALAWMMRGEITEEHDEALGDLDRALLLEPRIGAFWRERGWRRMLLRDYAGAIADFTRAIELDPDGDAQAWAHRANARLRNGDERGALDDAERALELQPLDWRPLVLRAYARARRGDVRGALEDAGRALEIFPSGAEGYFVRGLATLLSGARAPAIPDFVRALELDPSFTEARKLLAVTKEGLGDVEGARTELDRAITLRPEDGELWELRARLHREAGEHALALRDATEAVRRSPDRAEAWLIHARILLDRKGPGDLERAIADASSAIAIDGGRPAGWLVRGIARRDRGDHDEALFDLGRAIELAPHVSYFWRQRAEVHLFREDWAAAVADLDEALALDPVSLPAWKSRAGANARRGDLDAAIADTERLLELLAEGEVDDAELLEEATALRERLLAERDAER